MLISLVLLGFGLLLEFDLELFFGWECVLLLFLALLLFFLLPFGFFLISLLFHLLLSFLALHLLGLHVHQVDASHLLKHIHHARITLHELHHHLGVLLAQVELVAELRVSEVSSDSWISH
jgi:membrane protein YdbS with pleckstrin-like domain